MKNTLALLTIAACVAMPAASRAATKIDDPVKFVIQVYAGMTSHKDTYNPPTDIYTPALAALFKLDEKEANGSAQRLDSDFWSNSQDPDISAVRVSGKKVDNAPDRMIVDVKFKQGGGANENYFFFVRTAAGWKLDDEVSTVAGFGGADALSLTLKYGSNDDPVVVNH